MIRRLVQRLRERWFGIDRSTPGAPADLRIAQAAGLALRDEVEAAGRLVVERLAEAEDDQARFLEAALALVTGEAERAAALARELASRRPGCPEAAVLGGVAAAGTPPEGGWLEAVLSAWVAAGRPALPTGEGALACAPDPGWTLTPQELESFPTNSLHVAGITDPSPLPALRRKTGTSKYRHLRRALAAGRLGAPGAVSKADLAFGAVRNL